jgi:3-phosphoshikimate 1-carboxyvinyltransferase
MNITIIPKPLTGKLDVVSSKSLSHRYLIAAGLAQGKSKIHNLLESDDLVATKEALKAFNVLIDNHVITGQEFKKTTDVIDCKESGSTLRFMIPIAMLQREIITFVGSGKLPNRPLDVYFDVFDQKHNYYRKLTDDYLPLEVRGPIKPGYYKIRGDVSSQFITGLLYALPLLSKDSVIELTSPLESKGYVDLTLDVLQKFGIHILVTDPFIYIKGNQSYRPQEATVEGDYSQAAFFMVAGLLSGEIELKKLNPYSKQGDAEMVDIIKQMQGDIDYDHLSRSYVIKPSQTYGIEIDLSQIPDLGPILMVLAACSKGKTKFKHCERLKIKESNRLEAMIFNLTKLGVSLELKGDDLTIIGRDDFIGNQTLEGFHDHRIVMALSIAAIKANGPITITNSEAIQKSYPNFFKDYQSLGGVIQ